VNTYWPEGIEQFDCHPVVFFEVTLKDIMDLVCHETQFKSPECTWNLTSYVFELSMSDFSAASNCIQAMKLGDQIMRTNINFDEVFCTCYQRLSILDSFDSGMMDNCAADVGWIVPSPKSYCEAYFSTDDIVEVTADTSSSDSDDESFWMILAFIFLVLLGGVVSLNVFLVCTTNPVVYVRQQEGEEPTRVVKD